MRKALFLDRDGVVCKYLGKYLVDAGEFELMPGILELIKIAKDKGYAVAMVTNQPQIAKGLLTPEHLDAIHEKMAHELEHSIDGIYHCPHRDEDRCDCRKPQPGMILKAAKDLDTDLKNSWLVGDSAKDIHAGKAAGCKTIFLKSELNGHKLNECHPDHIVETLAEIASLI